MNSWRCSYLQPIFIVNSELINTFTRRMHRKRSFMKSFPVLWKSRTTRLYTFSNSNSLHVKDILFENGISCILKESQDHSVLNIYPDQIYAQKLYEEIPKQNEQRSGSFLWWLLLNSFSIQQYRILPSGSELFVSVALQKNILWNISQRIKWWNSTLTQEESPRLCLFFCLIPQTAFDFNFAGGIDTAACLPSYTTAIIQ